MAVLVAVHFTASNRRSQTIIVIRTVLLLRPVRGTGGEPPLLPYHMNGSANKLRLSTFSNLQEAGPNNACAAHQEFVRCIFTKLCLLKLL
ncbi:hypothetical protein LCGC14_0650370, partial [marine sediment metagenome]